LVSAGVVLVAPGALVSAGVVLVAPGALVSAGVVLVAPGALVSAGVVLVAPGAPVLNCSGYELLIATIIKMKKNFLLSPIILIFTFNTI